MCELKMYTAVQVCLQELDRPTTFNIHQMNRVNSRNDFGHDYRPSTINIVVVIIIIITTTTSSPHSKTNY